MLVRTGKSFDCGFVAQESGPVVISQNPIDCDDERSLLEVDDEDLLNCKVKPIEILLELPNQLGIIDFDLFLGRQQHLYLDMQRSSWLVAWLRVVSMDDRLVN